MNSKTIIIDNNTLSLKKLRQYMQAEMPQLDLIGSFSTIKDGLNLIHKENPKLVFVNIQDLDAEKFLQLQQMRNTACSIIFITPELLEENLKHLPQQLTNSQNSKKQNIRLKIEDTYEMVEFDDIIRLEAQSNYTLVYLTDRPKPVLTSRTLKWYTNQLDEKQFIRPHKSHLVNRDYIEKIYAKIQKYIVLKDGNKIKISRRKAKELLCI